MLLDRILKKELLSAARKMPVITFSSPLNKRIYL